MGKGVQTMARGTIFIPPTAPQSPSSIIWALYNMPEVAAVPSGLSSTPLIKKINKKYISFVYYGKQPHLPQLCGEYWRLLCMQAKLQRMDIMCFLKCVS
jgi:hypothetical protein